MVLLIINLNLNALYQTSLLNPDSSCHAPKAEMSCCEMEMEKMTEAECSLTNWIGVHQLSSCTCLHELNVQNSVILNSEKSNSKIIERAAAFNVNEENINGKHNFVIHSADNHRFNTTKIYLIDSSLLI